MTVENAEQSCSLQAFGTPDIWTQSSCFILSPIKSTLVGGLRTVWLVPIYNGYFFGDLRIMLVTSGHHILNKPQKYLNCYGF